MDLRLVHSLRKWYNAERIRLKWVCWRGIYYERELRPLDPPSVRAHKTFLMAQNLNRKKAKTVASIRNLRNLPLFIIATRLTSLSLDYPKINKIETFFQSSSIPFFTEWICELWFNFSAEHHKFGVNRLSNDMRHKKRFRIYGWRKWQMEIDCWNGHSKPLNQKHSRSLKTRDERFSADCN